MLLALLLMLERLQSDRAAVLAPDFVDSEWPGIALLPRDHVRGFDGAWSNVIHVGGALGLGLRVSTMRRGLPQV